MNAPATTGPAEHSALGDGAAVGLAIAVWAGASLSWSVPPAVVAAAALFGALVRRPVVIVLVGFLAASVLADRADRGLLLEPRDVTAAEARVVSDPRWQHGSVRAVVSIEGQHVDAWATGVEAFVLRDLLVGDRLVVDGTVGPLPASARWLRARHVAGRLDIDAISATGPPGLGMRAANGYRRLLVEGAASLSSEQRSLFTGLVFGDDRAQSESLQQAFRSTGLTHLLAVSGQNVAFVLAVAGPVLRRLDRHRRLGLLIAALAMFALVTRCEPSVLRATVMAGLAAVATTLGRPTPATRILAMAVTAVVLIDPFLVKSVGFQLSVAASAGILLLSAPMTRWLPLPRWVGEPIAVTCAAQVGVAPVQLAVFGPVPLASIPANVIAGPLAAAAMVHGLVAGTAAGIVGTPVADLVHRPTAWLTSAIAQVARSGAAAGLGSAGWSTLIGLGLIACAGWWFDEVSPGWLLAAGAVVLVVTV